MQTPSPPEFDPREPIDTGREWRIILALTTLLAVVFSGIAYLAHLP